MKVSTKLVRLRSGALTDEVAMSMDSQGRALDSVFTERLWRRVKYEEVCLHDYASPEEPDTTV